MQGFLYFDYAKKFKSAMMEMQGLMNEGKLKARIDMQYGIEECPNALKKLLLGENNGKVMVKVDDDRQRAKLWFEMFVFEVRIIEDCYHK